MTEIVKTAFLEPKPQPELGGEFGLTIEQLAEALGAQHFHVRARIRELASADSLFIAVPMKFSGPRGRPKELFILPPSEAKIIAARYENARGLGYLRHLIDCERRMTQDLPKLRELMEEIKARFEALNQDNARLRTENQTIAKALPKATTKREKRYKVPVIYGNMFGDGLQVRYDLRTQKECAEWQWAVGMLPMLVHLRRSLGEKVVISKGEVVSYLSSCSRDGELMRIFRHPWP